MKTKSYPTLIEDIHRAQVDHQAAHGYFARFAEQVMRLNGNGAVVSGISVTRRPEGALSFAVLDRNFQISVRVDHRAGKGLLHVQDVSNPDVGPKTLERVPFDANGNTGLAVEGGAPINLGAEGDCLLLALRIIDAALDYDPWF